MEGRITNARTRQWSWLIVGAVLVIAFLGHDLVMTSDAHHARADSMSHARPADAAMNVDSGLPDTARVNELLSRVGGATFDAADSLDDCGYDRVAVLTMSDGASLDVDSPIAAFPQTIRPVGQSLLTCNEPTAPPGVRRALLQVFLI